MINWSSAAARLTARAAGIIGCAATLAACGSATTVPARPHVEHVNLPTHQVWRVVSVQPYEGLEDVELVKVSWPTEQDGRMALALTREGLRPSDPICLDHIGEIDVLWAHPVPPGGCTARDQTPRQ